LDPEITGSAKVNDTVLLFLGEDFGSNESAIHIVIDGNHPCTVIPGSLQYGSVVRCSISQPLSGTLPVVLTVQGILSARVAPTYYHQFDTAVSVTQTTVSSSDVTTGKLVMLTDT
jgi:hypothetical protein